MGGTGAIRVVIVDDHALVREATRGTLERCAELQVIGEAADGAEAVDLVERLRPDVVVLDVKLKGLSGIEAARQMMQRVPSAKVLVLSAYKVDEYISAAMEAGVAGYLLKTVRGRELAEAILRVHRGETVLGDDIILDMVRLWSRGKSGLGEGGREALTTRETEVLRLVAHGLRNREIAAEIGVSIRTVEGHLSAILSKLGARSRTSAVMFAAAHNLLADDGNAAG